MGSVDFDIQKDILCSHQVKLIIQMISKFLDGYYDAIEKVAEDIEIIIFYHIYTKVNKL